MNRHLHRIVFNAARGMRMVVQETATSTGKGASKATSTAGTGAFVGAALAGMLAMAPVNAQIVGAPNVPGNLRPTVLVAPNGVPLINVQTPSAAGVSRNVYNQFNVGPNGAIFNNSRTNAQTQLGGIVQGNPYLAGGPARIILNEVNGGNVSQLRGYMEVAGQRAEIIIANPAGINVDGAGFINASRATLTTGTPQLNALGGLDSFLVRGGTVTINGAGLDASKTDYAAILARAVEANAGIWASELKVVTGANQVSADHSQISPTAGTGAAPTFALDVAALGGMYAGKIVLIGTEAGLGVRNVGTIQAAPGTPALAGAGQLVVTSAGRLENIGTIQATADANIAASNLANSGRISSGGNLKVATQDALANSFNATGGTLEGARVELASAAGNIDNRSGGTIRQTSSAALGISAPALSNTNGGVIGLEPVPETTSRPGGGANPGSGSGTDTGGGTATPGTPAAGGGSGSGATITPAPYVPPSPGTITAAGAILNDGGRIYAGGPITLQSANINNNGGTLSLASMTVNQPTFDNHGGTLNISNGFSANVDRFDNTGGKLNAGSLNIASTGDLINVDGTLTSAADANLTVGGKADNTRGTMSAAGALTANVAGATNNTGGTLASNQGLTLDSGSLDNTKGSIQSAQAGVQLGVTNALVNGSGGSINAAADLGVQAGSLANGGSLRGANDVSVAVGGAMANDGSVTAGRNTTIMAGSLQGSSTGVLGAGIQSDGKLGGVGELRVTTSGALVANGTNLAAGNATLQGASVDVSSSQTSAANIAVTATQGEVITSKATVVTPGTLSITASSNAAQTLANDAGTLNASQLQINVSNLANTNGGEIVQTGTGATTIATSGTLNNDGGRIASNGQDLTLQGATIGNVNGKIEHAGTGTLTIGGGTFNGANGQVTTNNALVVAMSSAFNQDGGATSAKQVTIDAASLSNRGGRIVQTGAAAGSIAVAGAVDNTSGVIADGGDATVATGDLSINAANIINSKGLIHSLGTTSLNAATILNDQTQGAGQGIEGKNVTIAVSNLNNDAGAIRADVNATITSGGTVTNTNGLISAGDTLAIVDPNAANPAAKTLNLVNTGGTLVADNSLKIDAATFSGDGKALSGKDLSIALTQDIVNNGQVAANGNLTYTTTGNFTNNGKLLAGQTLTVGGNNVDNTANAEMAGTDTIVNASGTLTNRGLIDSQGNTQINAGTLNNIGTGRIYGDDVSIAAGTLNNDAETVAGVTKAGTIAARGDLDIGATTINNREHALIFSQGSMHIGGALDANRKATGQGGTLNNLSADIESIGDMDIAMANVNNRDVRIQLGAPQVTNSALTGIAPMTPVGSGVGRTTPYPLDEVNVDPINGFVYRKDTGELVGIGGYGIWYNAITTTEDTAINTDPAHLVAGGNMNVNGQLYNENSQVLAGGTITATSYQSSQLSGTRTITGSATVIDNEGNILAQNVPIIVPPQTIALGGYKYQPNINATTGHNGGSAPASGGVGNAGGSSGANGGIPPGVVVEVSAITGSAGSSAGVPMVVRTSMPNIGIPNASLFGIHAGPGRYLIETDPRFANYRNWLSSDYLLNNLGLDPNNTLKRLGDGFYEQKLIREQVAQLTGYRYLDGYSNDDDQYTALMDAGATFAKQYGLRPGIGLSAAQMAQLTSDIVWLVEQTVTLPDGTTQRVLVPQVYVRVRPGDIDGSGALLSADATIIKGSGDVVNTGTVAGRNLVKIDAENVSNLGGRIAGGNVGISARNDLNNVGGTITARDVAVLTAGRDINIQTTTQSAGNGNTAIDRVAGVYVTNPGGTLVASAGRDVNLIGAALVSAGAAAVGAGRNINLETVKENYTIVAVGNGGAGIASESREVGSVIQGQDNVRLAAGNDLNIRAGAVASIDGALVATAQNNINVTAGQATSSVSTATQKSSKSLFRKNSSSTFDSSSSTEVLSSSLSGKSVALVAGNDVNLQAAQLRADDAMSLSAGRDINVTTATSSSTELHASQQRSSSTGLSRAWALASDAGGPVGGYGNRQSSGNSASAEIKTQAVGTTISAGSLQIVSGRDTTLQAATVVADKDITMMAGRNLTIESAQNTELSSSSSANSKSGFIGSWSAPGLGNIKDFGAQATSRTTQQSSQVVSLTGDVTLVAGNEYRQTASSVMAAGQAGPLAGGDVNILAKNVTINEAYNTEQTVGIQRSSSSKLGGSASFMGVSTDSLRSAGNTVRAVGDTGGDGRMQALGALNLAMAGKQAYEAGSTLAGALSGSGPGLTSMSEAGTLNYGVSVTATRSTSEGTSFSTGTTAVGSSVVGSNNVNIVATGAGTGSNIHAVGSTIAAGNTVNMAADNDIILEASRSATVSVGRNDSQGKSVGVTFGAGAQNGFSIQLGVQNGQGRDNQNDITYAPTQVSGAKAVNIASGRNLTLNGATIEANRVTADVGGNLNIASLQDVSVGQSRQSSSGFGVSLCIPPICYGSVATVSANSAGAKADGVFISPGVQSGIKAGDGGFDVNVKGNTNLTGAVIESTQAAIDAGKNSFHTGGALTMTDLQNVSQSSGSSYAVGGSLALGYTTPKDPTPSWSPKEDQAPIPLSGSPGVGSYSGNNQTSTTKSGISGIAGDQSVRTGDASSAGTLIKDWNTQAIIKNVQAQAQITQQFNQNISREIGTYAGKQAAELRARADKESDAGKKQALLDDAAKWGEGGQYRIALHTAAGALSGGVGGALGTGASAALMPKIGEAISQMGLATPVAQALGAVTAAAIGGIAGGTAGAASAYSVDINNRQLHSEERQLIGKLAADKAKQMCAGNGDCEKKAAVYWTDILEKTAKGQVDDEENAKNAAYLAALVATMNDPNSEGARGGVARYVQDLREAQGILSPYVGRPIVVNGVTQYSYGNSGQTQTYFSATPEQQADPYINRFIGQVPAPIVFDVAKRDAARLEYLSAQNGSAVPVHIAEEVLVGGAVINRGIATVVRLAESADLALAGTVAPSSGGNISAQKMTMEGAAVKLTSSDLNMLSQIEKLPNTTLQGDLREFVADNYFLRNGYSSLNGKCGSNCFDGVYLKDGKVYLNEVKPLNADGTIKLSPENPQTGLGAQMSEKWIDDAVNKLKLSGDPSAVRAADAIIAAKRNGTLVKVVSGINGSGMTVVKLK
jgi:filamentous hemagglutinin